MPIISFYEQADPDKMVRKACFVISDNSENEKKEQDEVIKEGLETAQKLANSTAGNGKDKNDDEDARNSGVLYVDFNPSTIKMSTGKGRKVNGTEPPSKSVASGRDPDFDKCYTAKKYPFDTTTTVSMSLIFDGVSKWDKILSGDDEEEEESRLESSYVGRFFKSWNAASKAGKSSLSGTMAALSTIFSEDVLTPARLVKDSVMGVVKDVREKGFLATAKDKLTGLGNEIFSNLKGDKYMSKLEKCNLFYKQSTYRRLEDAYLNRGKVLFLWGPMRFYGVIRNFSTTFSMFTRAGSPLRAQTNISIELFREVNNDTLNINVINEEYKEAAWIDEMYEEYLYPRVQNAIKTREEIRDYIKSGGKNLAEKTASATLGKGIEKMADAIAGE